MPTTRPSVDSARGGGEVRQDAPPTAVAADEDVGRPLVELERVAVEGAAVAHACDDDRDVAEDARRVQVGGHEVVGDAAGGDRLEELRAGNHTVGADEDPVRVREAADRDGVVGDDGLVPVVEQGGERVVIAADVRLSGACRRRSRPRRRRFRSSRGCPRGLGR